MTDLTDAETDDLFARLTPELQERVRLGEVRIAAPGENDKPVVIDATTGRIVEGSGRYLNSNDPAYIGKVTGYKKSRVYQEAVQQMVGAWKNDETLPDAIMSLEELVEAAKRIAVPKPITHLQEHLCSECGHMDSVAFVVDAKPDQKMLAFLIERLIGAATKTENINVHSEELVRLVSDKRVLHEVTFVGITPAERAERLRKIMEG